MNDNTIYQESNLGQRLVKVQKQEARVLSFNNKNIPMVGKITIGRDRKNSIVIENALVSRHHAVIQKIKSDFYIKDLESANGTFVNKDRVPKEKYIKITPGDTIKIGNSHLVFK
jgi:pSer/pThr/pTyr-binding forkhead associated (FHA) protein